MTLNVVLCPFVQTPVREPPLFIRRVRWTKRLGMQGGWSRETWNLERGLSLSAKSPRKASLLWVLKEETPVVLGVVDGRDSKRCTSDSGHGPSELRGCIGEKTACSSGGERELALFEKMAFFEASQAVVSERVGGSGNGEGERILKGNKMSRGRGFGEEGTE
jgi:hypothetical protein